VKPIPDPRFRPVLERYCDLSIERYGAYQWDASDGKALKTLLGQQSQLTIEKWNVLLQVAFDESQADVYFALKPGFRFREFAAHFVKVAAKIKARQSFPLKQEASGIKAWQIRQLIERFKADATGASDKEAFWEDKFQRLLGINSRTAKRILDS